MNPAKPGTRLRKRDAAKLEIAGRCVSKSLNHRLRAASRRIRGYGLACTVVRESAANQQGNQERMMRSISTMTGIITVSAILAAPAAAVAQEGSGRYATHDGTSTTQELPDGSKVQIAHYSQITFAADQGHPLDNKSADCMGRFHSAADGKLMSGSGTCTSFDADGNTASFWWRIDKIDTSDCAGVCGAWGYYAGTGKLKGIHGSGTFHRDTMFANGSSGTWKGQVSVK